MTTTTYIIQFSRTTDDFGLYSGTRLVLRGTLDEVLAARREV